MCTYTPSLSGKIKASFCTNKPLSLNILMAFTNNLREARESSKDLQSLKTCEFQESPLKARMIKHVNKDFWYLFVALKIPLS